MRLTDFYYELPNELIARYPMQERSGSRLLCLNSQTGTVTHKKFSDLIDLLSPNDLLVFNNTRVIPARLLGRKQTGGQIEVLVERILNTQRVLAHVRASKKPQLGSLLFFKNGISFEVLGRQEELFELSLQGDQTVLQILELIGEVPIPPYFERAPDATDKERYQTIYAKYDGSVAAPTAGLHFDMDLFTQLHNKNIELGYVTLHVGAGTFAPVRVDDITQHRMHAEYLEVSDDVCQKIIRTKEKGGRVIAVGTTTVRSLETACGIVSSKTNSSLVNLIAPYSGETDIFIYPGFQFQCVDSMVTNFHFPCSTLMMLVAAKAGYEHVMNAYRIAVSEKYRFFSYGDAMFIF
jgi:S-adenosylmethionine:tRNA ribosyltransferase-isomerase